MAKKDGHVGPAWFGIALLILSGCLGGGSERLVDSATGNNSRSASLPADYSIDGTTLVSRNETEVKFLWSGIAAAGAYYAGRHPVTAEPELEIPVPADVPVLLRTQLKYAAGANGEFYPHLQMEVTTHDGTPLCAQAEEELQGGTWSATCFAFSGGEVDETWRVRVLTFTNFDPALKFDVELRWTIVVQPPPGGPGQETRRTVPQYEPHVLVAVTDSGVNPYHKIYYRPERTHHPCTYIEGFPCEIPALNLSVGLFDSYHMSVAIDREIWSAVTRDSWYWIPRTNLVAVHCIQGMDPWGPRCILDADMGHGTATSSSVLQENPDALLVLSQGRANLAPILASPFPIDLHSHSWGPPVPLIADERQTYLGRCQQAMNGKFADPGRLMITAAGNVPSASGPGKPTTVIDCMSGNPNVVSVGGAQAVDRSQALGATMHPEVVSYFCRPVARPNSVTGLRNMCGTSFAAPTVAGALSRVILDLRRTSGYTGTVQNGMVDPILGVSNADVRTAMNLTSTYAPNARYNNTSLGVPANSAAPWHQWGWGFYDNTTTDATVAHLLGTQKANHPADAIRWMETQHEIKKRLWGS